MTIVASLPGGVMAVAAANGGKFYAFNALTTTPAEVAAANPQRRRITFHNPGDVDIFVAPAKVIVNGADSTLTPSTSALGGCWRIYANGGSLEISGECQVAWNAFAASGTGKPLTVMDSNT